MGQRYLQLLSSYTGYDNNTAVLHVNQMLPNPATFPPGPALLFVTINGVPSVGVQVMIGTGKLGNQPTQGVASLPDSQIIRSEPDESSPSPSPQTGGSLRCGIRSMLWTFTILEIIIFAFSSDLYNVF